MSTDDRFVRQDPNPIPLDALKPPDFDVREYRTDEDIENTARTLAEEGQVLPILVGEQDGGQYPILDGNHRYLAAKRLDWPDIDCIQTKAGVDEDEVQIIANISRLELSPSERLSVFDYMLNTLEMTVTDAANKVGIDRSQAHRYKKILTGYGEIKQFYMQDELGVKACYQLNQVDDRDRAVDIAETAVREGYHDKDVVEQARNARGDEEADDVMRGAGSEENAWNRRQVKANTQAMSDLEGVDTQGVREASVAAQADASSQQDETPSGGPDAAQAPPCAGCGEPMDPDAMLRVEVHPAVAEQLGLQQLQFGPDCMQAFLDWWAGLQDQQDVDGETPEAEP